MRKILFLSLFLASVVSCSDAAKNDQDQGSKTAAEKTTEYSPTFLNVTEFIQGQLSEFNKLEVAPLKIRTKNGAADSSWIRKEDLAKEAEPFLWPKIDSLHMAAYFRETAFVDQTINAVTFSYEPKTQLPDTMMVQNWDVYIDPETNSIRRVFIVKKRTVEDVTLTEQLTWLTGQWFKITDIREEKGKAAEVNEVQIVWNFDK